MVNDSLIGPTYISYSTRMNHSQVFERIIIAKQIRLSNPERLIHFQTDLAINNQMLAIGHYMF